MLKQPLFGQDSSPHRTSFFVSLLSTFIFWILFTVMAIFVKIENPSPQYKTVQIVLDSPVPVEQIEQSDSEFTTDTETAVVESEAVVEESVVEPSPVVEEAAQVVETVEPAVEISEPNVEPVKPDVAKKVETNKITQPTENKKKDIIEKSDITSKTESGNTSQMKDTYTPPPTYSRDLTDGVDFNSINTYTKTSTIDDNFFDSFFGDDSSSTGNTTTTGNKVINSSSTAGSAGTTVSNNPAKKTTANEQTGSKQNDTSDGTTKSLESIANAQQNNTPSDKNTVTDGIKNNSDSGNNEISMTVSDKRGIRVGAKIVFTPKAQQTITDEIIGTPFTITFRITSNGQVLPESIEIKHGNMLSSTVKDEIKQQIKEWIFDPGSDVADVTCVLIIKKR